MKKYGWAVNDMKLQRAIAKANRDQTPGDEEKIKAIYISMGGLVRETLKGNKKKVMENNEEVFDTVEETVETPVEETVEETVVEEETANEEATPAAE